MLPVLYFRFALKGKRDMQALHRNTQSTDRTWVFLTVGTKLVSCIALKDILQRLHGKCQRNPMLQVFSSSPQPRNWLSHIDKWDMWPHLSYLWSELMFYLRRLLSAGQVCGMADIDRLHVLLYLMHHSLRPQTSYDPKGKMVDYNRKGLNRGRDAESCRSYLWPVWSSQHAALVRMNFDAAF